ncbi:MAG: orotate phosphoribosyltransferase [Gemmatimonadetes bacterium]|nr:orotate phosphoribosyltransferase [Gemmatimonadota bacterium]
MDHRARLKSLLIERSLKRGDFTLASGARSTYYVDARRTTMSSEGQFLTGRVALDALWAAGLWPNWVGGLTMGADPVSYSLARASWESGHPIDAFSVRKQAKGHGTGQLIEGGMPEGARVIVTEDSMTSGASALKAIEAVEAAGAEVLAVLTVVDREEGGRERIEAAGYPLVALYTASELLEEDKESSDGAEVSTHA